MTNESGKAGRKILFIVFALVIWLLVYQFLFLTSIHDRYREIDANASEFSFPKKNDAFPKGEAQQDVAPESLKPEISVDGVKLHYNEGIEDPTHIDAFYSNVHCIGDTFHSENAWRHKSCKFHNLCFDVEERDFVVFRAPLEKEMSNLVLPHPIAHTASTMNTSVSIGGINTRWGDGEKRLEWFPRVIDTPLVGGYYVLADRDAVLVPYHSVAGFNVGHLVWDDFLPIYTLLSLFDFDTLRVQLFRYFWSDHAMWGTCERSQTNVIRCNKIFTKFMPSMGMGAAPPPNIQDSWTAKSLSEAEEGGKAKSKYICAEKAAAGIGLLTDHGDKTHGWIKEDYEYSHNQGRGKQLWDFRNYLMKNMGVEDKKDFRSPCIITFSKNSSMNSHRSLDFEQQIKAAQDMFKGRDDIIIQSFTFSTMSLTEQIERTRESTILVTSAGGGAVTSMFLPRGASLIIFFDDKTKKYAARLDWDYFNNASYLRAHWLPISTMGKEVDIFRSMLKNELDTIARMHD